MGNAKGKPLKPSPQIDPRPNPNPKPNPAPPRPCEPSPPPQRVDLSPVAISYDSLQLGTNSFDQSYRLGEGGFGEVYRAFLRLPNEQTVREYAVKKLRSNSIQGEKEWLSEIMILGQLHHPNLVRLYGFCAERGDGILVYEMLEKGSLEKYLFDPHNPIPWDIRAKIAYQTAKGIEFLHDKNVFHRDVKAPNILLDKDWNVKISDFGLARAVGADQTHVSTKVMGSLGYLDPKYLETGRAGRWTDVYSFGALLLELITGRAAAWKEGKKVKELTSWARPYLDAGLKKAMDIVDPNLVDQIAGHKVSMKKVITIAKHCITYDDRARPNMRDVVRSLENAGCSSP